MIKEMNTSVEGNKLTVEVVCSVRHFASHPIKILTTEHLVDILKKDYSTLKLLKKPERPVANTNRKKMSNSGTWVFEIQKQKAKVEKNEQAESAPKPTKRRASRPKTEKTSTTSIRSRISKLATKED